MKEKFIEKIKRLFGWRNFRMAITDTVDLLMISVLIILVLLTVFKVINEPLLLGFYAVYIIFALYRIGYLKNQSKRFWEDLNKMATDMEFRKKIKGTKYDELLTAYLKRFDE